MTAVTNPHSGGLSVIIPTHRQGDSLRATLRSLDMQSAPTTDFEVIIVSNGEVAVVQSDLQQEFPRLNLRCFHSPIAGAGRARNIGLAMASLGHITFLDDDDQFEHRFVETALGVANSSEIALMPIVDVTGDQRDPYNTLNLRISALAGTTVSLSSVPWVLGFNACKIISTEIVRQFRYREDLPSGEDVVYFAHLLQFPELRVTVPKQAEECAYLRSVGMQSVSRQTDSFDFNVKQRLQCLQAIQEIDLSGQQLEARRSLERSQFGFIKTYLETHRQEVESAIELAAELGVWDCDWEPLRGTTASRVVFSYCFPPYSDTSANMAAKTILAEDTLVDVFYADMSAVRSRDESTLRMIAKHVVHSEEIATAPSFSDWNLISDYAMKAYQRAKGRMRGGNKYSSMYSRALWSGSHVAALLFKQKFPLVAWDAEFSDPMTQGADGRPRVGALTGGPVTKRLKRMLKASSWSKARFETHFELTELLTIIYADKLIFTNENQMHVILDKYPADLAIIAKAKSVVRHHVVPPRECYSMVKAQYEVSDEFINLAYFGNFYPNRGIGAVVDGIERLSEDERSRIRLHVFTSNPGALIEELENSKAIENLRINPFVDYLTFLNLCTQFDVLVVNDTSIEGTGFVVNPFLPSKYSDYVGSGTPIWGLVTEGSTLSTLSLDYRSHEGNLDEVDDVLGTVLKTKLM